MLEVDHEVEDNVEDAEQNDSQRNVYDDGGEGVSRWSVHSQPLVSRDDRAAHEGYGRFCQSVHSEQGDGVE